MNRLLLAVAIATILLLGPLFVWGIIQDYGSAVRDRINENKPARAKIHQAQREIETGTKALGATKVGLTRIQREQSRLQDLLAQAPLPVETMQHRHEKLKRLVARANQTGQQIRYQGRAFTADEMRLVLIRQRTYLESLKQYEQALVKLEALGKNLESMIVQAIHERALAQSQLAYARSLTRIATTVDQTSGLTDLGGVLRPFDNARDTLLGVIAHQEMLLAVDRPSAIDGSHLFESGEIGAQ